MKIVILLLSCTLFLFILTSCDNKKTEEELCSAPSKIVANATCSTGQGLVLTAIHDDSALEYEWTIVAVKDSAAKGWTGKDLSLKVVSSNILTVSDTLTSKYKTLFVSSATKCQDGTLKHSIDYEFTRAKSATANSCIVWMVINPN